MGVLGRPLHLVQAYSEVTSLSWSPDGAMLAAGSGQRVHVYAVHQQAERFSALIEVQVSIPVLMQGLLCRLLFRLLLLWGAKTCLACI